MKIDTLETHDRLLHFKQDQALNVAQGAEDCLTKNYLSLCLQEKSPYIYIFAHPRTADDGVTKIMYWQPRLTKPQAQTNSYLFRAVSKTDVLEICWLLPPEEMWSQYSLGNVTENELVLWSIAQYKSNKEALEAKDPEDLNDEQCKLIYTQIAQEIDQDTQMDKLYQN
jgi:hypothetical protein